MATGVDGEWLTQVELARVKDCSRQAISKRWNRMKAEGLIHPRREGGREKVRLAEWDIVTDETTEPARLLPTSEAPSPAASDPAAERDPGYSQERTRQARYEADLKELRLKRELGEVLATRDVVDAMSRCAERIVRDLDQLPAHADDLAAAFTRAGAPGLRDALKGAARRMRETLEANMRLMASEAEDAEDPDSP